MLKKAGIALLTALMAAAFTGTVFAEPEDDFTNDFVEDSSVEEVFAEDDVFAGNEIQAEIEGVEVDDFTGEYLSEDTELPVVNVYWITDRVYFDMDSQLFCTTFSNNSILYSSVMNGMKSTGTVTLEKSPTDSLVLYRNGEEIEFDTQTSVSVSEPGDYLVNYEGNGSVQEVLQFTIVSKLTNAITGYEMPEGFRIKSAYFNDELLTCAEYYVQMEEDGQYVVNYECPAAMLDCNLVVTLDRTPPTLLLEAVNEKGFAQHPVSIADKKKDDTLVVYYEGKEVYIGMAEELKDVGEYRLVLSDPAGNVTQYGFTIQPYLNISAGLAIALGAAILLAIIGFIIYTRKYMRVR